MKYFICNKKSLPSCRILRDTIDKKIVVVCDPLRVKKGSMILRYGNSFEVSDVQDLNLNPTSLIKICSNKLVFSRLMQENNIPTPVFYRETPEEFPVLIRETLTGSHGIGIHVSENKTMFEEIWRSGFYWTPFINFKYELRVHVLGRKLTKVFSKRYIGDQEEKYLIRNSDNCHFSLTDVTDTNYSKLKDFVNKIAEILGDGFYALDIGLSRDGYFVIESNSAPGLNSYTVIDYSNYILSELNKNDIYRTG